MYLYAVIILNGVVKNSTTEIITKPLVVREPRAFYISTRMTQGL
jgi:hypothetical protein